MAAPIDSRPSVPVYSTRRTARGLLGQIGGKVLVLALVAMIAAIFVLPLWWMIITSFKPEQEVFEYPPNLLPRFFVWQNYPDAIRDFPFVTGFTNTMIVIVGTWVGRALSCSLAAFCFARLRFPGRDVIFVVVLSTLMIPYHAVLIPQYLIFRNLGWLNDLKPLFVPEFFAVSAFTVFLLRQFFRTIPREYDDAARVDGCGIYGIYWHIILPNSLPVLGAVTILTFIGEWNDFLRPLIYLDTVDKQTLAIGIAQWSRQADHLGYHVRWVHIMAVSVLITLIPVAIFFFAQRYFIQGVVISGVKG